MRIAVVGDTHGRADYLLDLKDIFNSCDALFFTGDGFSDVMKVHPFLQTRVCPVRGNNDFGSAGLPTERVEEVGGVNFFVTHGHLYGVDGSLLRLECCAREKNCRFALYGHTHAADIVELNGLTLINPGSLAYPRGACRPSYCLIESSPNGYVPKIVFI